MKRQSDRQSGVISWEEATKQPTQRLLFSNVGDQGTCRASNKATNKAALSLERENGFSYRVKVTRGLTEQPAKQRHLLRESDKATKRSIEQPPKRVASSLEKK
jgi:hypothetical protein